MTIFSRLSSLFFVALLSIGAINSAQESTVNIELQIKPIFAYGLSLIKETVAIPYCFSITLYQNNNGKSGNRIAYVKAHVLDKKTGCIEEVHVEKSFRHKNIGASLVIQASSFLQDQGCTIIKGYAAPFEELDSRQASQRLNKWYTKKLDCTATVLAPNYVRMEYRVGQAAPSAPARSWRTLFGLRSRL